MPPDQRSPPRGDEPTEPRTPATLEARQILEHAEADLFGAAEPSSCRSEILRHLAAGGMGSVHAAHNPPPNPRSSPAPVRPGVPA